MFFRRLASGGIPRGMAQSGPAILSYGFRPFFLAAGIWAIIAMVLWVAALVGGFAIGGKIGAANWHAHEMVFGYTAAVLAGFMLTAVPNWTGRLPVSGGPLLILVLIWLAGRLVFLAPDVFGLGAVSMVEGLFLPALGLIALREIVAGRNWKNLKVLVGILVLTAANIWFHVAVRLEQSPAASLRLAIAGWTLLIILVGGRIIPSFTRNWLARQRAKALPAPFGSLDQIAIGGAAVSLLFWTLWPTSHLTAILCAVTAVLHGIRLARWRGYACFSEPIVAVMHVAYLMLIVGLVLMAAAALEWVGSASTLHVLLIGAIGGMTLSIMTRAALGHTGRPIRASGPTQVAYLSLFAAALVRPLVDFFPQHHTVVLSASGVLWVLAFTAFLWTYAPILFAPRLARARAQKH